MFENITGKGSADDQGRLTKMVKNAALEGVRAVESIDAELAKTNSAYEVGYFRVMGSATVVGGVTLDIHFVKTAIAKQRFSNLIVKNPGTGKEIAIPRAATFGKKQVKVRDPDTGEILVIDVAEATVLKVGDSSLEEITLMGLELFPFECEACGYRTDININIEDLPKGGAKKVRGKCPKCKQTQVLTVNNG